MTEEERIQALEQENQQLRDELKKLQPTIRKRAKRWWKNGKRITEAYLGRGLTKSFKQLFTELAEQKNASKETLANLAAQIVVRFTRLGRIGFLLAAIPILFTLLQTWLLFNQNRMIDKQTQLFDNQNLLVQQQNKRLDQQTYLQEADRRSALVFLMGNIFDEVNQELKEKNNTNRSLSPQLIGRIIALSSTLLPYRFLVGDSLTPDEYSPERGQLLITLLNSNIDTASLYKIYNKADFSKAYLINANLFNAYLKNVNLIGANLSGAGLWNANLREANLREANLKYANLSGAYLIRADLSSAYLSSAYLWYADLREADLRKARVNKKTIIDAPNYEKKFLEINDDNDSVFMLFKKIQ